MSDPILSATDVLREKIKEKVEEIKGDPAMAEIIKMQAALNTLESLSGISPTTLASLFSLDDGSNATRSSIAPDEFVNLTPLDASKKFLARVGRPARPFAQIVDGVRKGGGIISYEDRLRIQLVRSGDVKKVGEDLFGLSEWYPARKGRPPAEPGKMRAASLTELADTEEEEPVDENGGEEENASPATNE